MKKQSTKKTWQKIKSNKDKLTAEELSSVKLIIYLIVIKLDFNLWKENNSFY